MPTPPKPCPKCNGYLDTHGSAMNVYDYHPIPGMPTPEIKSANDHENHFHGTRTCDECKQEFHGHFSFGSDHPDSPIPYHAPDRLLLVHKKCVAKLEAESQAKTE